VPHTLILGGTRGLGREVARVLSASGHHVSVIGRREPEMIDRDLPNVKHSIVELGADALPETMLDEIVKERGNLNYLVFCQRYRGSENAWQGEFDVSLSLTKTLVEAAQERDRLEVLPAAMLVRNPLPLLARVVEIEHRRDRIDAQSVGVVLAEPVERAR